MRKIRVKGLGFRVKDASNEKKYVYGVCASIFFLMMFNSPASAEDKEFKKGCRACHSEQLGKWDAAEVRHYPFSEEKCEACHAAEHKKFTAEKGKPCVICHDLKSEKIKKPHFSSDLTDVNCFNCHYTHGADKKGLLKEAVHMPFASGMCEACHNLNSAGKIEVKAGIRKVCLSCHSNLVGKDDAMKHSGFEMLDCVDCHNPHTSSQKWLLTKKVSDICFDCHDKTEAGKHPYDVAPSAKIILDKSDQMWLTYDKQISCISCHNPHSGKIPFLLREPLEDGALCNICHPK